jgi:hypothetical protein
MRIEGLILPPDTIKVVEFVERLKLESEAKTHRKSTLRHMKEYWGENLGDDQDGYIDDTVTRCI